MLLKGYLTVEEVAKQLDLSEFRATKIGQWRIKPEDLDEFVKAKTNK